MYVKMLLFLVSASLSAYSMNEEEMLAMDYIFGAKTANQIVKSVDIVSSTYGDRISEYNKNTGRIEINAARLGQFRSNVLLVHEAIHLWQDKKLHRTDGWTYQQPYSAYIIVLSKLDERQGLEVEAEMARQLSIWYLQANGFAPMISKPDVYTDPSHYGTVGDSVNHRVALWRYLSLNMGIYPSSIWDSGLN